MSYTFDDNPKRIDLDAVWAFLSTDVCWLRWRTRADVEKQVRGAWQVVGIYDPHGTPVRPRVFSDRRKLVQKPSFSLSPTSNPRTSRRPSAATPTATTTAWET